MCYLLSLSAKAMFKMVLHALEIISCHECPITSGCTMHGSNTLHAWHLPPYSITIQSGIHTCAHVCTCNACMGVCVHVPLEGRQEAPTLIKRLQQLSAGWGVGTQLPTAGYIPVHVRILYWLRTTIIQGGLKKRNDTFPIICGCNNWNHYQLMRYIFSSEKWYQDQ